MRARRGPGGTHRASTTAEQSSSQTAEVPACFGPHTPFAQARVRSWREFSEGCAHSVSRRRNKPLLPLFSAHCLSSRCSQNWRSPATPEHPLGSSLCLPTDSGPPVSNHPQPRQRKWCQCPAVCTHLREAWPGPVEGRRRQTTC